MFFRKKKDRGASPETPAGAGGAPARAGGSAADPASAPSSDGEGAAPRRANRDVASTQFLTGEAQNDRRSVQVLLEAIARVSEHQDLDTLLCDIVDRSVEVTGAERGILLLRGGDGLIVRLARSREGETLQGDLRFSTTVARKVLDELEPVRATVNTDSEALDLGRSVFDLKLRAVMCVPLVGVSRDGGVAPIMPQGVLYVDSRAATRQFDQRDLSLFAALAQHIAIALENAQLHLDSIEKERLRQSMELASAIQRDLMPVIPAGIEGFDVHGWFRPAEGTGGDFYDFVKKRDGMLGVVLGDATGHGIGPALITAAAQAGLRSYLRMLTDPAEVVALLNNDLCERVDDGRFLTLYLGLLSPTGELHGINAGHAPPLVWRKATGQCEELTKGGPALGMLEDIDFDAHQTIQLGKGDMLVIFSDGLTEARDPAEPDLLYGQERFETALTELGERSSTAREVTLGIVERVLAHAGGNVEDDMTLVVVRRTE